MLGMMRLLVLSVVVWFCVSIVFVFVVVSVLMVEWMLFDL